MISDSTFMNIAVEVSASSYAVKKKVGCIIVKNHNIIAIGYNGTPSGFDNNCETLCLITNKFKTNKEVLHAESNAIAKCATGTSSSEGAKMYCTYSPCFNCAKLIVQAKIKTVYFKEYYKLKDGLALLKNAGIEIKYLP